MKPSSADCERFGRFVTAMQGEFDAAADLYASMRREATEMFVQLYEHQGVQGVTALEAADKGAMKLHTVEEWIEIAAQDPAPKVAMVPLGRVRCVYGKSLLMYDAHDVKPGAVLAASCVFVEGRNMPAPPMRAGRLHVVDVRADGTLVMRDPVIAAIPALCSGDWLYREPPTNKLAMAQAAERAAPISSTTYRHLMDEFQRRYNAHTHSSSPTVEPPAPPTIETPWAGVDLGIDPPTFTTVPDPLDVKYDGVALRVLLEIDVCRRRGSAWHAMRNGLTSAQRAAVSAHWSAELRARVEAGKRADAMSVVLDCAEEL